MAGREARIGRVIGHTPAGRVSGVGVGAGSCGLDVAKEAVCTGSGGSRSGIEAAREAMPAGRCISSPIWKWLGRQYRPGWKWQPGLVVKVGRSIH